MGGTSGTGCAAACQLVALGTTVVITFQDTAQSEKASAVMLSARGVRVVGASLDLTNLTDVQCVVNNLIKQFLQTEE